MACVLARDARSESYCAKEACKTCGWTLAESERRKRLLEEDGLSYDPTDKLRYLDVRPKFKRAEESDAE